jgi:hypothetical protein
MAHPGDNYCLSFVLYQLGEQDLVAQRGWSAALCVDVGALNAVASIARLALVGEFGVDDEGTDS